MNIDSCFYNVSVNDYGRNDDVSDDNYGDNYGYDTGDDVDDDVYEKNYDHDDNNGGSDTISPIFFHNCLNY